MYTRTFPTLTALARSQAFSRLALGQNTSTRSLASVATPDRTTSTTSDNIKKSTILVPKTTLTRSLATAADPVNGNGRIKKQRPSAISQRLPDPDDHYAPHRFREFDLEGRVVAVTGGAQGLGLAVEEALVEAGAHVYCLDIKDKPDEAFLDLQNRLAEHFGGSLHYIQVDVQHAKQLDDAIASIAEKHGRMDGLVANAAVQNIQPALDYPPDKVHEMMGINFGGVYSSAISCARQMIKYKTPGSIVLIGSMSGLIANKGLKCSVYNSSKGAVIQLGRSLAMEWGRLDFDGETKAIRVNVLSPGNIRTPMVEKNFADDPTLEPDWKEGNMMGRISMPHEYRGAILFMLSDASSFMTGSNLVIDGGYTAW